MLTIDILTLFPQWFDGPLSESILARARERGVLDVRLHNFRDSATDRHHVVDDTPYGGGGGMVLKPEPLCAALDAIAGPPGAPERPLVLLTSPQGPTFSQPKAKQLAQLQRFVLVCGHYEGLDQRVIDTRIDEEISVGDYVLTGGELPAMLIVDAVARMLPGTLGNPASAMNDSFYSGLLDCPHYTRPEVFEGQPVPEILLSGHHARIEQWRRERALLKTAQVRPDLLAGRADCLEQLRDLLHREPYWRDSLGEALRLYPELSDPPARKPKRRGKC